jgi:methyl-accepting chemotaxis protein
MFKNLKVGQRIGLAFAFILIMLAIIAIASITQLANINEDMQTLSNDRYPKAAMVNEIAFRVMDNARILRNLILNPDEKAQVSNKDAYDKNVARNQELYDQLDKSVASNEGKELLKAMEEARTAFRAYTAEVVQFAMAHNDVEATKALYGENYKTQAAYFTTLKKMVEHEDLMVKDSAKSASDAYLSTRTIIITLSIAVFLLGAAIAFLTTRSITRQLGGEPDYVAEIASRIASGDLSMSVVTKSGDTTSMLITMKQMQGSLKEMVAEVQSSADQVSTTATQLAAASSQVAEGSRQQAEAASSMAASVEEMTVSIDQVSSNAGEAKAASTYSGELSEKGAEVIHNAVVEMGKIDVAVKESAAVIAGLQQQADGISAIVNVIKEIAEQTNLLALNAAIEAARAGEQGRGFAVVADEVRKLAERTANSTREISAMIENIQGATHEAVASMESGGTKVSSGVTLANQAGQSIQQIKTEVNRVAQVIIDISDSLKEQSIASRDIAVNVEKIAQMSEENSAAVEHASGAAHHLEQLASSLQRTIGRFRI